MQIVGGYSLVRLLGSGRRAEVYLGRSAAEDAGRPRAAAIKVFRGETSLDSVETEIDALARVSHRHLLRLEDLTTTDRGSPGLVLQRLDPRSLSRLLLERGELSPGEVVSIVSPVASAVEELHRSGVSHRRLRSAAVLFDHTGAPVVAGFGRAVVIGPVPLGPEDRSLTAAELEDDLGVLRDIADLCALARTVVESSPPSGRRDRLLVWLDGARSTCPPDRLPLALAERVFELGSASPIDLDGGRPPTPARVGPVRGVPSTLGATPPPHSRRVSSSALGSSVPSTGSATAGHSASSITSDPDVHRPSGLHALHAAVVRTGRTMLAEVSRSADAHGFGGLLPSPAPVPHDRAAADAVSARPRGGTGLHPDRASGRERRARGSGRRPLDDRSGLQREVTTTTSARVLVEAARTSLAPVRRRVWVASGLSAGLLVVALVVVTGTMGEEGRSDRSSSAADASVSGTAPPVPSTPSDAPAVGDPPSAPPSADEDSGASIGAAAPEASAGVDSPGTVDAPAGDESPTLPDRRVIDGDDPVAASVTLLQARRHCLADGPSSCLDGIDQADSAAMDADRHLLDSASSTADDGRTGSGIDLAATLAVADPVLVQRIGDSAILSLSAESLQSTPASLLLVRGEAGWRIRDLIVG
jgi:hypothetical protein